MKDDDLARTRLAISPLWELFASLFALHDERPRAEYAPWVEQARRALRDVDLGPLDLSHPLRHSIPDFAAPIPKDPLRSLSDEIERVRATEPAVVRANIAELWGDDPPPPWDAFVPRPREMVDRLADALEVYWQAALADDWPQLRAVLEGEMLARARALAVSGPGAVLEDLHPSVRWRHPMIELVKDKQCEMYLDGRPLVLIPLVFARGVLMGESQDEQAVALGYQARGTAALWTDEAAGFDGRLELLLGHGRAAREVAAGRADLSDPDHERAWRRLRAIPGIGSWTIEMLALYGQGRYDQLPAGDLGYLRVVGRIATGNPRARVTEDEVRAFFAPYEGWAGLAGAHLLGKGVS